MATFLDANLFAHFNSLFVFLFVLVAIYAIMLNIKIFENNFINFALSLIVALLFASSATTTKIFEYATPWIVLLFIVLFFLILLFKFTGAEDVMAFKKNVAVMTVLISIIVVIFVLSAGEVNREKKEKLIEEGVIEEGENPVLSFPGKVGETLRHPAMLGLIIVFLIAAFAAMLLAATPKK